MLEITIIYIDIKILIKPFAAHVQDLSTSIIVYLYCVVGLGAGWSSLCNHGIPYCTNIAPVPWV